MTVYLITENEEPDFCGIIGSCFKPEIYSIKEKAELRMTELEQTLGHSGLYYTLDDIIVDKKN